jgi:hypothetical protein
MRRGPRRSRLTDSGLCPRDLGVDVIMAVVADMDLVELYFNLVLCRVPLALPPAVVPSGTTARPYPALHRDHAVVHTDRIRAMQDARKAIEKYLAQASIGADSQHRGSNPGEQDLALGVTVLTFRKDKGWVGPFQLISVILTLMANSKILRVVSQSLSIRG